MSRILIVGVALLVGIGCQEPQRLEMDEPISLDEVPNAALESAQVRLPDVELEEAWKVPADDRHPEAFELRGRNANGKYRDIKVTAEGEILEVD